jgi:hypothetical protein
MEFGVQISPFDQTFRAKICPQSLLMKQDLCSTVSKDSGNVPERNVKVGGASNSTIPSLFDHVVRNPSTIKSNYQQG